LLNQEDSIEWFDEKESRKKETMKHMKIPSFV